MLGGISFLLFGKMVYGIIKNDLIVRVGVDRYEEMLEAPHTKKFDITGKPIKGWVMVLAGGLDSDKDFCAWVKKAVAFVRALPPK